MILYIEEIMKITELKKVSHLYEHWREFKEVEPEPECFEFSEVQYVIPNVRPKKEFVVGAIFNDRLVGMGTLYTKVFEHMKIGGIGKMAVRPDARRNGIAREILLYLKNVMERNNYDISVLWASILSVYESVGYKAYRGNMMVLPVRKDIEPHMIPNILDIPSKVGTW